MKIGKGVFLVSSLLFGFLSYSQPGDKNHELLLNKFNEVQDSIAQNSNDPFYKWARLQILFTPTFDLHTKSTDKLEDYALKHMNFYREYDKDSVTVMRSQQCDMCPNIAVRIFNPAKEMGEFLFKNQKQLLKDLNTLIASGIEIKAPWNWGSNYSANKASYLYKRGQFYYVTGKAEKALEDYLEAIKSQPSIELRRQINISIAAYYYNSDLPNINKEKQAFMYLNQSGLNKINEEEKIKLLFSTNDSTFIINYLQNESANYLRKYLFKLNERKIGARESSDELDAFYSYQKYVLLILNYLKEKQPKITNDELKEYMLIIFEKL